MDMGMGIWNQGNEPVALGGITVLLSFQSAL